MAWGSQPDLGVWQKEPPLNLICLLCDPGQVTVPLWATVASKMGTDSCCSL